MIVKIKNISIVILIVFFFPIILLILFIRPFVILRFGNIEYKRIGHLALDTAIYLSLKKKMNIQSILLVIQKKIHAIKN